MNETLQNKRRISCCVPFCRRTSARYRFPAAEEIICGQHWRMVPADIKAGRTRLKRRSRKIGRLMMCRSVQMRADVVELANRLEDQMDRLWLRNWERCKQAAIESAAGIS